MEFRLRPAHSLGVLRKARMFKSPADDGDMLRECTNALEEAGDTEEHVFKTVACKLLRCRPRSDLRETPPRVSSSGMQVPYGLGHRCTDPGVSTAEKQEDARIACGEKNSTLDLCVSPRLGRASVRLKLIDVALADRDEHTYECKYTYVAEIVGTLTGLKGLKHPVGVICGSVLMAVWTTGENGVSAHNHGVRASCPRAGHGSLVIWERDFREAVHDVVWQEGAEQLQPRTTRARSMI